MINFFSQYFFSFIFLVLIIFSPDMCYAMEEALTIGERAAQIGEETGIGLTDQIALKTAVEETLGQNILETSLSPELRSNLENELKSAIESLHSEGQLGNAQEVESRLNQVKNNFFDQVDQVAKTKGGLPAETKNALEKFNFDTQQVESIVKYETVPNDLLNVPEGVEVTPGRNEAVNDLKVANDKLKIAQQNFDADPSLAENKEALTKAQQTYDSARSNVDAVQKDTIAKAQQAKVDAQKKLSNAQQDPKSTPKDTASAQEEVQDADKAIKDADLERALNERLSSKQNYDRAKLAKSGSKGDQIRERDLVKERAKAEQEMKQLQNDPTKADEYNAAKEKYDTLNADVRTTREQLGAEGKLKIAQENYEAAVKSDNADEIANAKSERAKANEELRKADENLEKAQKEWMEKAGPFEAVGLKLKTNAIEIGKSILHNILAGFVFSIPNMVIETITNAFANMQMLKTLRSAQQFGGIWMRIPEQFIDEAQPSASKFIYVGLKDKDQAITDEYLKTAHFYVARPDYGDLASTSITDPTFPNIMLHLNTGYIFVGDGSPLHTDNPTMPLIGDKGLQNALDKLAGEAAKGPERKLYESYEEKTGGYDGSEVIAHRLSMPKDPTADNPDQLSPVLQDMAMGLRAGEKFGVFTIKPAVGIGDKLEKLVGGQKVGEVENRVAPVHGVYLYRTQDTPSIKAVLEQIASTETDSNKMQLAQRYLVDYVVMLDNEYNVVPLQIPIPQPPSNFPLYALNPKVAYVVSLLDQKVYDIDGKAQDSSIGLANAKQLLSSIPVELNVLVEQVQAIITSCQDLLKYGPFFVG